MNRSAAAIAVQGTTLVEILRKRSELHPDRLAYVYLVDGERDELHLTFGDLARGARAIAARLHQLGSAGERALLLAPPGLEYVQSFLGCLLAGVIPVPLYPPRLNRSLARIRAVARDAAPAPVLVTEDLGARADRILPEAPELAAPNWLVVDRIPQAASEAWREPVIDPESLAFLQYTSGSTGAPRGVMVRHENLVHNARALAHRFEHDENSRIVSWLPLHHDMGLIGNVVQSLYAGIPCVLMSPMHFLEKPRRWLDAISRHRATTSGGPNFAYDLCVEKIPDGEASRLDLHTWSNAFNGAEPVRPQTLERFAVAFAPCGFRREAFYPSYGLAEATLFVSGGKRQDLPQLLKVRGSALGQHCVVEGTGANDTQTLVGCGHSVGDQVIRIVEPVLRRPCAEDEIGEIWVSGPSVAAGYWNHPRESEETFRARLEGDVEARTFLRTGDLGFLKGRELFVTGRLKDLIIVRGLNHYPQDIEMTAERCHAAIRPACTAAFSIEVNDQEQLVVAAEIRRAWLRRDLADVIATIRAAVAEEHEVRVHAVALLSPGSIPKTTSGKIRRQACRDEFREGRLQGLVASDVDSTEHPVDTATKHKPRTPEERLLADAWTEVLGVESIGLDDHFFRLGGDS